MIYNKVYAQIGEERHIVLDPINYQYDVKQILVISGETVPEYYEADICNVGDTATLTMIGTAADGVEIPDKFLLDGRNVLVYVVIPGSGGDVQTRYDITIPVDERAEREDIDPSEAEQQQIDSLIAALNSGVGRAEAAVTHYPKIVDGYWTVWNAETETWVNTGIRAEGRDGYSPEVTITEIEGGHRVTITDEDHPQGQTFDVMDGQGGSTGDYDELTNRPRINGHTLTGNQSASDLELGTYSKPSSGIPKTDLAQDVQQSLRKADTALQTAPVQSVAGKTGAVNLGAEDIGFNSSEEYNEGTVGAELSELNRQLSDVEENQIPELKNAIDANEEAISDTQSMIATVEATTTASKNYAVGDLLVYDGKLYKVTSAIATGATITVGTNVTQTTVESQIASGGGEDNWCVIANMELTEAIGSSTALNVFLDLTTDIDGHLLSDKKIRHLVVSVHYADSDDGLPNGMSILLNESRDASGGVLLAKNKYTTVKIDVLNSTHVLCWTSEATQSFSQSNVVMAGTYAMGKNRLNNKDTIERVRLQTNYPNGTILPAGSSIVITGW